MRSKLPTCAAALAAALLTTLPLAAQGGSQTKRVDFQKRGAGTERTSAEAIDRRQRGVARDAERATDRARAGRRGEVSSAGEEALRRRTGERARLAGLDHAEREVAKRFLLEQKRHNERLAKLHRLRELFERRGDRGKIARVDALIERENQRFEKRKQLARKALAAEELEVLEEAGRSGTRAVRARGGRRAPQAREQGREGSR